MTVIIDRFEGEFARVELSDGKVVDMPRCLLPQEAVEGDVITISVDPDETASRKKRIDNLMGQLFK